ncbi:MAG: hypothetical protein U1D55_00440 [Phycisphaerae bacterium]
MNDAWNRLTGVWYADAGGTGDEGQRVAAYAYDALFRRVSKSVSNQGLGCVHGSDAGGMAGIQAGDRAEHYFYSGWRDRGAATARTARCADRLRHAVHRRADQPRPQHGPHRGRKRGQ